MRSWALSPSILVLERVVSSQYSVAVTIMIPLRLLSTGLVLTFLPLEELPLAWVGPVCHQPQNEKLFQNPPRHTAYTGASIRCLFPTSWPFLSTEVRGAAAPCFRLCGPWACRVLRTRRLCLLPPKSRAKPELCQQLHSLPSFTFYSLKING